MTELERCQNEIDKATASLGRYNKALLILAALVIVGVTLFNLLNVSTDALYTIGAFSFLFSMCWSYVFVYMMCLVINIFLLREKRNKLYLAQKLNNDEELKSPKAD